MDLFLIFINKMDLAKPKVEVESEENVAFETIISSNITPSMKPSSGIKVNRSVVEKVIVEMSDATPSRNGNNLFCEVCGIEAAEPANLIVHKGSWHRLRNFFCDPCGISSLEVGSLKEHRKNKHVRSNPSTAWCWGRGSCLRSWAQVSQELYKKYSGTKLVNLYDNKVQLHKESTHEGLSMWSCGVCGSKLEDGGSIKQHRGWIHEGRVYKCCLCKKGLATRVGLKPPKLSVHEGSYMSCGSCGAGLQKGGSMEMHGSQIHEDRGGRLHLRGDCFGPEEAQREGVGLCRVSG